MAQTEGRKLTNLKKRHEISLEIIRKEKGDPNFEPNEGAGVVPAKFWNTLGKREGEK